MIFGSIARLQASRGQENTSKDMHVLEDCGESSIQYEGYRLGDFLCGRTDVHFLGRTNS